MYDLLVQASSLLFAIATVTLVFRLIARRYGSGVYWVSGIIALALHVLFSLFILPKLPYGWDIHQFHEVATVLAGGRLPEASSTVGAFSGFQATAYAIFTPDPTIVSVLNALFAVLLPLPVAYLATRLYPDVESTQGLTVVVLYLPVSFVFLSLPMRDSMTVALTFATLACGVRAFRRWDGIAAALGIPCLGMLYLLRPELAILVVLGCAAGTTLNAINCVARRPISLTMLSGIAVFSGAIGFSLFTYQYPLATLTSRVAFRRTGGAAYLTELQYQSWLDVLLVAPIRAIYFQYAPFPLHVTSVFDFVGMLSLPLLIALTVVAFRSFSQCRFDDAILITLVIVYGGGVVGYGLIDSNFGTTIRHRIPFVLLMVVFAAPVVERWERLLLDELQQWPQQRGEYDKQDNETHEL
ncbi:MULTISPECIES: hypothetical protein [Halorussus]|uniref:hypothetical protein n=1 Tax=Halorussus TaxID=1070314 RepID=UPI000E20ECA5|nr:MULTISPECIES: hypothetical protein [Halorussus]NHN60106.1 hypothetical protein [Halorussus sp. JP-T4]